MTTEYEKFPQPEELKVKDLIFSQGMNKSKRSWKVGLNRHPTKCTVSRGPKLTWEEKKKQAQDKKILRDQLRDYKEKKIAKRKEIRELRKQKKQQKVYNEIKSGKFEVIKNTKNIKKWSKKIKSQLVKLPAEVFESVINR